MGKQKYRCGQCEFYLKKKDKCPHQERTAFSEGCNIFTYTNPETRIDALRAENNRLIDTLMAAGFIGQGTQIIGDKRYKELIVAETKNKKLKEAVCLLNSMILYGGNYSDKSKKIVQQALKGGE